MLGRLVLLLLQVVVGWWGSNALMGLVGSGVPGNLKIFLFAVVAAIAVFLVGVIAAQVLKEVGVPGSPTLSSALVLALIAALLWTFGPQIPLLKEIPWGKVPALYAVLAGAILGYHWKRRA